MAPEQTVRMNPSIDSPNGKRLPLHEERREAAGKYDGIGWHTLRHTYRSWLDDTGAPMGCSRS